MVSIPCLRLPVLKLRLDRCREKGWALCNTYAAWIEPRPTRGRLTAVKKLLADVQKKVPGIQGIYKDVSVAYSGIVPVGLLVGGDDVVLRVVWGGSIVVVFGLLLVGPVTVIVAVMIVIVTSGG